MLFPRVLFMTTVLCACNGAGDSGTLPVDPTASLSTMICGAEWTTRNLEVSTYRNGDTIPQVRDAAQWVQLNTGAWCWYNNDSARYHHYGKLYNWYAVHDPRGLAPTGWHVLQDSDWEALESCLGADSVGYRMRMAGAGLWPEPATHADNSSGFSGLPGGIRSENGTFSDAGTITVFWTSTEGSASDAWCVRLIHYVHKQGVPAMVTGVGYMPKSDGYAVRCVKDR